MFDSVGGERKGTEEGWGSRCRLVVGENEWKLGSREELGRLMNRSKFYFVGIFLF